MKEADEETGENLSTRKRRKISSISATEDGIISMHSDDYRTLQALDYHRSLPLTIENVAKLPIQKRKPI